MLHLSAEKGHLNIVSYLVNQKADINSMAYGYGKKYEIDGTPLHWAANNGHLCVVEYLVNQKADINAKNTSVEFSLFIEPPFIMLLEMDFFVLLNAL